MPRQFLVMAIIVITVAASSAASGQEFSVNVGWQWGGTQEFGGSPTYPLGGDIHANANTSYGGALGVAPHPDYTFELSYTYQRTDLIVRPNGEPDSKLDDMNTHYIMVHGIREAPDGNITPFFFTGVGVAGFESVDVSRWFLAFDIGGGGRFHLSETTALRLQVRGLFPVQWFNSGFYFGSGGPGFRVGGGSTLIQGEASLGLTFNLGH